MKKKHSGFTLVELLVVISIIGMLMGLLVPAVNYAREAGRRATCMNNQRQVALAIVNYDNTQKELPSLRRLIPGSEWELTWVAQLLPYLEQGTLYQNIIDLSLGDEATWIAAAKLADAAQERELYTLLTSNTTLPALATLRCPSSLQGREMGRWPDNYTSYIVNAGPQNIGPDKNDTTIPGGWATPDYVVRTGRNYGIFFDMDPDNRSPRPTVSSMDFISGADGMTNTILLSESVNAGRWIDFGIIPANRATTPTTPEGLRLKYGTCGIAMRPSNSGTGTNALPLPPNFGYSIEAYQQETAFTIPASAVYGDNLDSLDTPTATNGSYGTDGGMSGSNWALRTTPRDMKTGWVNSQYVDYGSNNSRFLYTGAYKGLWYRGKPAFAAPGNEDWDYRTARLGTSRDSYRDILSVKQSVGCLLQSPGEIGEDVLTLHENLTANPPIPAHVKMQQFPAKIRFARPVSDHPSTVIVAMCDGSAQVISVNIDPAVYTFMVTPKSGMVIDNQL